MHKQLLLLQVLAQDINQQNTFTLSTTRIDEIDVDQRLTSNDYGFLANVISGVGGATGLSGQST